MAYKNSAAIQQNVSGAFRVDTFVFFPSRPVSHCLHGNLSSASLWFHGVLVHSNTFFFSDSISFDVRRTVTLHSTPMPRLYIIPRPFCAGYGYLTDFFFHWGSLYQSCALCSSFSLSFSLRLLRVFSANSSVTFTFFNPARQNQ